jgi:hypothetical protein
MHRKSLDERTVEGRYDKHLGARPGMIQGKMESWLTTLEEESRTPQSDSRPGLEVRMVEERGAI